MIKEPIGTTLWSGDVELSPWELLANAIVKRAAEDYRHALKVLKSNPSAKKKKVVMDTIAECETFFRSEWMKMLTKLDGEILMKKIQEEPYNEC